MKPVKLFKKKAPKKKARKSKKTAPEQGREKETWDKDQSPGKHTAQKRRATRR
jgi:hypothetical protein